jgi:hypothetical protein
MAEDVLPDSQQNILEIVEDEPLIPGGAGGLPSQGKSKKKETFFRKIVSAIQTNFWIKFLLITFGDIRRSKAKYFLGFFSCLLVVVVISVLNTVLRKSPIFFLSMAVSVQK